MDGFLPKKLLKNKDDHVAKILEKRSEHKGLPQYEASVRYIKNCMNLFPAYGCVFFSCFQLHEANEKDVKVCVGISQRGVFVFDVNTRVRMLLFVLYLFCILFIYKVIYYIFVYIFV